MKKVRGNSTQELNLSKRDLHILDFVKKLEKDNIDSLKHQNLPSDHMNDSKRSDYVDYFNQEEENEQRCVF